MGLTIKPFLASWECGISPFLPAGSGLFQAPSGSVMASSLEEIPPSTLGSSVTRFAPYFPFSWKIVN